MSAKSNPGAQASAAPTPAQSSRPTAADLSEPVPAGPWPAYEPPAATHPCEYKPDAPVIPGRTNIVCSPDGQYFDVRNPDDRAIWTGPNLKAPDGEILAGMSFWQSHRNGYSTEFFEVNHKRMPSHDLAAELRHEGYETAIVLPDPDMPVQASYYEGS